MGIGILSKGSAFFWQESSSLLEYLCRLVLYFAFCENVFDENESAGDLNLLKVLRCCLFHRMLGGGVFCLVGNNYNPKLF